MKQDLLKIVIILVLFTHCSTTEVEPVKPLPEVPEYTKVQHPTSFDLIDIKMALQSAEAPKQYEQDQCDAEYSKLSEVTLNLNEIQKGLLELVKENPEKYHWCFYSKLYKLHEDLKVVSNLQDKQKKVLETYAFITPLARAYYYQFHDTRYLRMAVYFYKQFSSSYFYRNLEETPEMAKLLVIKDIQNPFGFYQQNSNESQSVLEKYGLRKPVPVTDRMIASEPVSDVEADQPNEEVVPEVNSVELPAPLLDDAENF